MSSSSKTTRIKVLQARIDVVLNAYFDRVSRHSQVNDFAPELLAAMQYAVLNGGKRMRPLLVYAGAFCIAGDHPNSAYTKALDQCAAAVELIHCYSLVHDDLPAMDDDDVRRGKPTCHIQFNEATAILVGDALQNAAFELLLDATDDANLNLKLLRELITASGVEGLIGGQAIDLGATNTQIDLAQLSTMHRCKTGALIASSVKLGALVGSASPAQIKQLETFALAIGLAFQIQDDILDIESDTKTLGKTQGSDLASNKSTYPQLLGLQAAKDEARNLITQAHQALEPFAEQAQLLRLLADFIIQRTH